MCRRPCSPGSGVQGTALAGRCGVGPRTEEKKHSTQQLVLRLYSVAEPASLGQPPLAKHSAPRFSTTAIRLSLAQLAFTVLMCSSTRHPQPNALGLSQLPSAAVLYQKPPSTRAVEDFQWSQTPLQPSAQEGQASLRLEPARLAPQYRRSTGSTPNLAQETFQLILG